MNENRVKRNKMLAQKVIQGLESRNMEGYFAESKEEALKLNLIEPLKDKNHFSEAEIIQKTAGFQKISLNNFLSDECNDVIDIDSQNIQIFDANMEKVAEFLESKKDYQIIIATDYKERVKEILNEYEIFNIKFIESINASGTEISNGKILLITDRELFNKRQKDVPSGRKRHYKEKAEYIESINDIKEGEYVVHTIHGVGVYQGLTKQEFDGQLKDYLTIEYANKDIDEKKSIHNCLK